MRTPTRRDICGALHYSRWLLSLREPLGWSDRAIADLGYEADRLSDALAAKERECEELREVARSACKGNRIDAGAKQNGQQAD
jgi:hypothetical protein